MPSEGASDRRLHPLSWIFLAGTLLKGLIFPAIVFIFASRGAGYEIWALVFIVPTFAVSLVRHRIYRYRLDADEMVIRDGLLTRNERHIPYARIQNIDLVQNPLHRMLGVATVRLETASGAKAEALIRVLSMKAIEEMRSRVFAERSSTDEHVRTPADSGRALLELPTSELVKLGLISNRGMALVAAATGILWQTDLLDIDWEKHAGSLPSWMPTSLPQGSWLTGLLLAILILVVLLVLLRSLSIVWTIIKLHHFRLARRGDDLRAEYGLFTRVTATIPTPRIQLISIRESWLHRCFGSVSVRVKTAGGSSGEGEDGPSTERQWLAPIVDAGRAARLIGEVLPEIDLPAVRWRPIEARAARRMFARTLLVVLVPTAGAVALLGAWGLLLLLAGVPWAAMHARLSVKHAGWALTSWGIIHRWGWWGRNTNIVRFSKVQSVEWIQTPFDRRHAMARLGVDTAGSGSFGQGVKIPYLSAATATELTNRLYAEASRTAFRW